jgi:iron complex transport system substrate-binding protein
VHRAREVTIVASGQLWSLTRIRGNGLDADRRSEMVESQPTPRRIGTFLASATEIVCALGQRERLVGVSHECDYPSGVEDLPRLTRARVSAPGSRSSRELHDEVESLVKEVVALYEVDLEALRKAAPDVLVTQDLCAVCALGLEEVRKAACQVLGKDVTIISLAPKRLDDVWEDVRRVGEALGLGMTAEAVANGFRSRVGATARRAEVASARGRPSVLAVEWIDPVMVAGLWMPDLVELAGGRPLVTKAGELGVVLEDEMTVDPDVVLVKPCGFDLPTTLAELDDSDLRRRWPRARWYAADGNAYFNRSGPRLVESLEILAACVHPEAFADLAELHKGRFVALT